MMEQLQSGQMLGAYRIMEQVGQGGMATVYKAYHAAVDRQVAIKVLPSQLVTTDKFVDRFRQEARTIANLEHARILPVYDYGEDQGIFYLVMRYLDSGTLKDRLKTGALSPNLIDRWFTQLAEALAYAHKRGVIHRDLKPSNVLVDAQDDLYLTDFGIAKLLEADPNFTATGAMMGTPAYISPEQAQGEPIDPRSDIYSLGIILYELVTGQVPYEAETPLAVVLKQISAPLPLPTSLKPDLAPAIERVLLKALAKEPVDRFATVADFLAAWKRALTEAAAPTMSSAAPAAATMSEHAVRRPPLGLILGGAVVLLLLVGLILLPQFRNRRAQRLERTAPSAEVSSDVDAAASTPAADESAASMPSAETFNWQSWSSANNVRKLFIKDDRLYAAGPGGVTVWNLEDGEVLHRYTTGDGLPNPNIFALWVDDNDTLWVGTEGGLARLDPDDEVWTIYGTEDGLDSDFVAAVAGTDESLIVGTQYSSQDGGGLNIFDGQSWQALSSFPSTEPEQAIQAGKLGNRVNVLLPIEDDYLWVGTEAGLGLYERSSDTWTIYTTDNGLPDNQIYALYLDAEDRLVVGTPSGAARFDGETFTPTDQSPPYGVYGIGEDEAERLYLSGGGGVWRYDPERVNWEEFSEQSGDLTIYNMTDAAVAEDVLFFGSEGAGVWRYEDDEFTSWYIDESPVQAGFGRIMAAPTGDELWFIEAFGAYIDHYELNTKTWLPYIQHPCGCQAMAFDAQGNLWGASWQAGFFITTPGGQVSQVSVDQGLPAEYNVSAIAPLTDGTAWIGLEENGLARYEAGQISEILTAETVGFASDAVQTLFIAADGTLWVGVEGGLSHLQADGSWEHFGQDNLFDETFQWATDMAEDEQGGLWVTALGSGVYRLADGGWTHYVSGRQGVVLPSVDVHAVTLAPDGSIWFGTEGGAVHFDGEVWTPYRVKDGLIHPWVYDIYVEQTGTVWFATAGGAARWGP